MAETTLIRNADWIVAWDPDAESHVYLTGGDLAFAGKTISFVGRGYDGPVGREIDGGGLMVMPGLVDLHSHPWSEALNKGFAEDYGNPALAMTSMFDHFPGWWDDEAGYRASAAVVYAELLRSGVTTLVDLSTPYEGWLEGLGASGLRGVAAPMMRSALWRLAGPSELAYDWLPEDGAASFAAAFAAIDRALSHPSGRLSAMVMPAQVDTCSEAFLKRAQAAARERGLPLQIHAAQSVIEVQVMLRRHGKTPVAWLDKIGLLAPDLTLSHAPFLDSHSWIWSGTDDDLSRIGGAGASVAHCPMVLLRKGTCLEYFHRYRAAGVNMAIGTDTYPHNMLEEMRLAANLARIPARGTHGASTTEVFEAATIGGAKALLRDDIGRLAPGCKADLVLVDCSHPLMQPLRDPLRSLIHTAAERAVRDVYVDGVEVVRDGRVLTLDYPAAIEDLKAAALRAEARVPEFDIAGRDGETLAPLSLPRRRSLS